MEQPRKAGRPATGQTRVRSVRIGGVWDEGEQLAKALDISMTAYVEQALRRENARVRRAGVPKVD